MKTKALVLFMLLFAPLALSACGAKSSPETTQEVPYEWEVSVSYNDAGLFYKGEIHEIHGREFTLLVYDTGTDMVAEAIAEEGEFSTWDKDLVLYPISGEEEMGNVLVILDQRGMYVSWAEPSSVHVQVTENLRITMDENIENATVAALYLVSPEELQDVINRLLEIFGPPEPLPEVSA